MIYRSTTSGVLLTIVSVTLISSKNLPDADTSSQYPKVAHWGAAPPLDLGTVTETSKSQGRSQNSQSWIQRTRPVQKNDNKVVYHYASSVGRKPSSKLGTTIRRDPLPGVGEVIQERFNPKPYFEYGQVPSKYESPSKDSAPKSQSSDSTKPTTFDSFPVFDNNPSPPADKPSPNLYDSPYSSYNPPSSSSPGDDNNVVAYPPNFQGYQYNPPTKPKKEPETASLGPPLAPPGSDQGNEHDFEEHPPPGIDHYHFQDDHDDHDPHFPHLPKDPSSEHEEVILDHPPPGYEEDAGKDDEAPTKTKMPQPATMGNMGNMGTMAMNMMPKPMKGHDMAEQDLSPPPSQGSDPRFPQYLYDGVHGGHDYDSFFDHHHVYKEITTTTTTEAPEDERVNKGHYSYYFLGRKLWYIPLYFSVYFIIYVTVLILKSIARHKVQFKHDHFGLKREQREMDLDRIDEIHANITNGIEKTRRKIAFVAM